MNLTYNIPRLVVGEEVINQFNELKPEPDMEKLFKRWVALKECQDKDQV